MRDSFILLYVLNALLCFSTEALAEQAGTAEVDGDKGPSAILALGGGYLLGSHTVNGFNDTDELHAAFGGHGWHVGADIGVFVSNQWLLDIQIGYSAFAGGEVTFSSETGSVFVYFDDMEFSQKSLGFSVCSLGMWPNLEEGSVHAFGGIGLGARRQFGGVFTGPDGSIEDKLLDFWGFDIVSKFGLFILKERLFLELAAQTAYAMLPLSMDSAEVSDMNPSISSLNLTVTLAAGMNF